MGLQKMGHCPIPGLILENSASCPEILTEVKYKVEQMRNETGAHLLLLLSSDH